MTCEHVSEYLSGDDKNKLDLNRSPRKLHS